MSIQRKKMSVALSLVFVLGAGSYVATHFYQSNPISEAKAAAVAPATEVDVATVISKTITEWQSYSGRLEAVDKVDIRPQVSGRIVAIHFEDGALVKKGDSLFTIDPAPYAAEVQRSEARLAAAETKAVYLAAEAARAERLLSSNAVAKREYDERQNEAREAAANLRAAVADLSAARINLAYTKVIAPVSGRVSRAELTLGNTVNAGANAPVLTTLVSVSPIYASFNVDEQTYLNNLRHSKQGKVPVSLGLADEAGYSRLGTVSSVDNQLNTKTSSIRVRARFDNSDGSLLPGLYARLKVGGSTAHPVILVDDAAISTDQSKKYVLVVDKTSLVSYREVTLGALHEGLRVITSGLEPNEQIVVNGLQRARPNEVVKANLVEMVRTTPAKSA